MSLHDCANQHVNPPYGTTVGAQLPSQGERTNTIIYLRGTLHITAAGEKLQIGSWVAIGGNLINSFA